MSEKEELTEEKEEIRENTDEVIEIRKQNETLKIQLRQMTD